MRKNKSDQKRTDEAWDKLHARLNREGLLTTTSQQSFYTRWKAAAIWVVAILSALTFFLNRNNHNLITQQTIHNMENESTRIVVLEDSSIVYLAKQSALTYPTTFAKDYREVTLEGNAIFQVKGNPKRPFRINAGTTKVEVLGTTFYVKNDTEGIFESGVKNGKVKITLQGNKTPIYVNKGEKVKQHYNLPPEKLRTEENDFDPYTKCIHFKDEELSHILQIINSISHNKYMHFETTTDIGKRKLTFTYTNNSPEDLTELICIALGISYQQKGKSILFTK